MRNTEKKHIIPKPDSSIVVNNRVKSYHSDPVFVKKAESAKELIRKYGLPGDLVKPLK